MQALSCLLVAAFVVMHALDSMFRWILVSLGAGAAIYVRDFLLLLAALLTFFGHSVNLRDIRTSFWALWTFGLLACVGLLSELGLGQVLFGLKVWLPFIAGFLVVDSGMVKTLHRPKAWAVLWAALCVGVFINYFYRFPWIGLTIQIGDVAVSGNREWNAYGVSRLSGFSRSSYDAAMAILVLYGYLFTVSKSLAWKILLIIVSGAAIALTTAKGAAGSFLIAVMLAPMLACIRSPKSIWYVPCLATLGVIGAVGLVAPLVSFQIPFPHMVVGSVEHWLFSSMLARAWETWPQALDLLSGAQAVTGRGIGGIGAAQYIFEAGRENPADNLFVYLYVTAGVLGAGLYVSLLWASRSLRVHTLEGQVAFLTLLAVFSYGMTASVIENAIFSLALGLVVAWMLAGQTLHAEAAPEKIHRPLPRGFAPSEAN